MTRTIAFSAVLLHLAVVTPTTGADTQPVCSFAQCLPGINSPAEGIGTTVADMNSDGLPDLVCRGQSIRVMAASRTGELSEIAGMAIAPAFDCYDVACADLNGDSRPDVVAVGAIVTCSDEFCWEYTYIGAVQVFLNDGAALTPQPLQTYASDVPIGATLADLNGDGVPDLALTVHVDWAPSDPREETDAIMIFVGDGAGAFAAALTLDAGVSNGEAIVADLTFDGHPDIVFASQSSFAARVYPGDGALAFGTPIDFPVGPVPRNVITSDLNADGFEDLLVEPSFGPISLFLSSRAGAFAPVIEVDVAESGSFTVGDFDDDGDSDVLGIGPGMPLDAEVVALRNDGRGNFLAPEPIRSGDEPQTVSVADFDGDGFMDVAGLRGGRAIYFLRGRGAAGPFGPRLIDNVWTTWLDAGDLDADGDIDLVGADLSNVRVRINDGTGHFTSTTYTDGINGQTHEPHLVDLNADGRLDLVVTGSASGSSGKELSILIGQSNASFSSGPTLDTGFTQAYESAIGDVDGDGDLDIAATVFKTGGQFGVQVFRANGTLSFGPPEFLPFNGAWSVHAGDLDHDGSDEFVVTSATGGVVAVVGCDATGAIAFRQVIELELDDSTRTGVLDDLDHDGDLDLVVVRKQALQTLLNDGGGTLVPTVQTAPLSPDGYAMELADMTGDGFNDAVVAHSGLALNGLSVLQGNADGTFTPLGFFSGRTGSDVVAADFDQDGDTDVVVSGKTPFFYESLLTQLRPTDLDCDGLIGASDLAILLGAWGSSGPADFDGDGTVGENDLAILLGAWSA